MKMRCTHLPETTEDTLMLQMLLMIKMLISIFFNVCFLQIIYCELIEDFQPGEFWKWKKDQFYEVVHGATFETSEGFQIVDMGDVNNDKTIDLISLSFGGGFGIHYYMEKEMRYRSVYYES